MANPNPHPVPPLQPGATIALTHGGYSDRAISERAEQVTHNLFELAPWLATDPIYVVAVARFCRVEARSQLLSEGIAAQAAEKGILKVSTRLIEVAATTDRLAARLGDDLGLSPLGKARLKSETATGELGAEAMARLAAKGQPFVERRQAELAAQKDAPQSTDTAL